MRNLATSASHFHQPQATADDAYLRHNPSVNARRSHRARLARANSRRASARVSSRQRS